MKKALLLIFSACMVACTSIDCPVQHSVMAHYAVMTSDLTAADTLRDTLSVTTKKMDRKDTLLLNQAIGVTSFSVNVSYTNPEDTLFFQFKNYPYMAVDTVWMKKENTPHFESVDCSASYFHSITAIRTTHHAIDTVTINNPSIDYDPQRVHFHLRLKSHN